jgi:hypothetical protein
MYLITVGNETYNLDNMCYIVWNIFEAEIVGAELVFSGDLSAVLAQDEAQELMADMDLHLADMGLYLAGTCDDES